MQIMTYSTLYSLKWKQQWSIEIAECLTAGISSACTYLHNVTRGLPSSLRQLHVSYSLFLTVFSRLALEPCICLVHQWGPNFTQVPDLDPTHIITK